MVILLVLFFLALPLLVLYLCQTSRLINKLGAVGVAYLFGLVIGNSGLLPAAGSQVQELLSMITIPLAIPLMLFSTNLRQVFRLAGTSFISLVVGVVSVTLVIISGYFVFRHAIPEAWKISGLLVGVYTGGTPNLASLKLILDVDEKMYLLTHSADLMVGVFYLFFLMTFGQRFFLMFLKPYDHPEFDGADAPQSDEAAQDRSFFSRRNLMALVTALVLALMVAGASVLISQMVPPEMQMAIIMLLITTFSLMLSFVPAVNRIPKTFDLGIYFVLVFSVVVASMVDVTSLTTGALEVVYYVTWVVFGSLVLQVLLSRLFKIDADTVIITSTALICSPPFVPMVAGALRNRSIIVPGITIGIVGYAIGNYLGFLLASLLH
jgi:uncharacterized membrane protein